MTRNAWLQQRLGQLEMQGLFRIGKPSWKLGASSGSSMKPAQAVKVVTVEHIGLFKNEIERAGFL